MKSKQCDTKLSSANPMTLFGPLKGVERFCTQRDAAPPSDVKWTWDIGYGDASSSENGGTDVIVLNDRLLRKKIAKLALYVLCWTKYVKLQS